MAVVWGEGKEEAEDNTEKKCEESQEYACVVEGSPFLGGKALALVALGSPEGGEGGGQEQEAGQAAGEDVQEGGRQPQVLLLPYAPRPVGHLHPLQTATQVIDRLIITHDP